MPKKFIVKYDSSNETDKFTEYFTRETIGFRTNNSNYFKNIMNFIHGIVDQINMKLDRDGLRLTSMDNAHISLVDIFIPKQFFKGYNNGGEVISIGINMSIITKLLNHLNYEDELIFSQQNDNLDISFINIKYKKFYSIKTMNLDYDELDIQDIENPILMELESKYFNDLIGHFNDIGETIHLEFKKNSHEPINLKCKGDLTDLNIILEPGDTIIKNVEDLNIEFNLKNLQTFSKGYNLNKTMSMEIARDNPLKLSYKILDSGYINYYIAPKIEEEDDEF